MQPKRDKINLNEFGELIENESNHDEFDADSANISPMVKQDPLIQEDGP